MNCKHNAEMSVQLGNQRAQIERLRAFTPATVRECPNDTGLWWMNDPNADGWEPVDVRCFALGRVELYRIGSKHLENSPSGCVKWIKLEAPKWLDDQARGATGAAAPTEFRLPVVAGRRSLQSNADFERACLVHIERLQLGIGDYDSAMLATFAEAVRMVREYTDAVQVRNHNTGLSGDQKET